MNKKKGALILGILAIGLSVSVVFFSQANNEDTIVYNMNPDNSKKIKPPVNELVSERYVPVSDMAKESDLIAKVKVINREEMIIASGIEIKNMPKEDYKKIGLSDKVLITKVTLQVLEEYKGKAVSSQIVIHQQGYKNADNVSIRLKDNTTYIAFLTKREFKDANNVYGSFGEQSYFIVDKNKKLTSLETDVEFAKYDTLDEKVLINDIKKFSKK